MLTRITYFLHHNDLLVCHQAFVLKYIQRKTIRGLCLIFFYPINDLYKYLGKFALSTITCILKSSMTLHLVRFFYSNIPNFHSWFQGYTLDRIDGIRFDYKHLFHPKFHNLIHLKLFTQFIVKRFSSSVKYIRFSFIT